MHAFLYVYALYEFIQLCLLFGITKQTHFTVESAPRPTTRNLIDSEYFNPPEKKQTQKLIKHFYSWCSQLNSIYWLWLLGQFFHALFCKSTTILTTKNLFTTRFAFPLGRLHRYIFGVVPVFNDNGGGSTGQYSFGRPRYRFGVLRGTTGE